MMTSAYTTNMWHATYHSNGHETKGKKKKREKEEGRGLTTILISLCIFTVIESSHMMAPEDPRIELSVAENLIG